MNRISVRGVTVALAVGGMTATLGGGVAALTAMSGHEQSASAAASTVHGTNDGALMDGWQATSLSIIAAQQQKVVAADWVWPASKPKPKPKPKPVATHASRSLRRTPIYSGNPRDIARSMMANYGWTSQAQWNCLDALWTRESNWSITETNASSGAYGIPQALPASKMASAGADWRTNPATQIRWGLGYIADRYGTPCGAWNHSQNYNFY